jgi:hypothetical protein
MSQLDRIEYQLAYLSGWVQGGALVVALCAVFVTAAWMGKLWGLRGKP